MNQHTTATRPHAITPAEPPASSSRAVRPALTTQPPPFGHPLRPAYEEGYRAGITRGIALGRARLDLAEGPVRDQFLADVHSITTRPGPLEYAERQKWLHERARNACQHPGWTPEQIRAHAARSWGLNPTTAARPPTAKRP